MIGIIIITGLTILLLITLLYGMEVKRQSRKEAMQEFEELMKK